MALPARAAPADADVQTYPSKRLGPWSLPAGRSAVMAIVNVTPDSFSDGGACATPARLREAVVAAASAGADLIDFGAESTRPGAAPVTSDEQLERLRPVFDLLPEIGVPVSIDTRSSQVAAVCLERGFEIVNDVSGGRFDPAMADVVASAACVAIVMHARGTPETMDALTDYRDPWRDVLDEWRALADRFLLSGCDGERVWFDPGFGFAKSGEQNWQVLRALAESKAPGVPTVVGVSRKRFVDVAGVPAMGRDPASNAVVAMVAARRRAVFRTHDVAGAAQAVRAAARFAGATP